MLTSGGTAPTRWRRHLRTGLWLAATCAAAGGAYATGLSAGAPHMTHVAQATCGVAGSSIGLSLPLEILGREVPHATLRIGPLELEGMDGPVQLAFQLDRDELRHTGLEGDTVIIPLATDAAGRPPKRLTLGCRGDRLALVRFDWERRRPEYVELAARVEAGAGER